jgi:hypothetical protein
MYNIDVHNTHAHPEYTYTNTIPISTSEGLSRQISNSGSHHMHLVVDGDVATTESYSVIKFWNKSRKIRTPVLSQELRTQVDNFHHKEPNELRGGRV